MTTRILLLLVLGGLLGVPEATRADTDKPARVEVWGIRATKDGDQVSPELKGIAEKLKKQFKYTGFTLEKRKRDDVQFGKSFEMELVERYAVVVRPKERSDGKIKLEVVVTRRPEQPKAGEKPKQVLKVTVTVKSGTMLPVGGLPLGDGDALILAVRAR